MQARTKRQRQILKFIGDFITEHGYQPSYQQIAKHLGVTSKGGVAKHIEVLEKKGLIERKVEDGHFRLSLVPQKTFEELICEIEWLETPNRYNRHEKNNLYIPKLLIGLIPPHNAKAFIVPDDGLIEEQICEDDVAFIEVKSFIRDGEIIAALVEDNEVILRKYYRLGSKIELSPANPKFETKIVTADKLKILGIFRGLIRPYM